MIRTVQKNLKSPVLFLLLGGLWTAGGCGGDRPAATSELTLNVPPAIVKLESTRGCLLDVDCAAGLFCFQNQCTWECRDDEDCGENATCSGVGRCQSQSAVETRPEAYGTAIDSLDGEREAEVPAQLTVELSEALPSVVEVDPGEAFVSLRLRTRTPVPGSAILYRIEVAGKEAEVPQTKRALGERDFLLQIPTGRASGLEGKAELQRVNVVTSVGAFPVDIIPRISVSGLYAADVEIREFGGGGIPIRFGLRVLPEGSSFAEAKQRFLLLPVSEQEVFAPAREEGSGGDWIERELEWDEGAGAWFARFGHDFSLEEGSLFARPGGVERALRIEIHEVEGRRIEGAISDRWFGLFDARSADGVIVPGQILLGGRMSAQRIQALPVEAEEARTGSPTVPVPQIVRDIAVSACGGDVYSSLVSGLTGAPSEGGEEPLPSSPCVGMHTVTAFQKAGSPERARCALAVAESALRGPSTASQVLAFLDDGQPNPGGISFGAFLERCAEGQGYCVASKEIVCAGDLLAYAYRAQGGELEQAGALLELYQTTAREAYLGRQLAAFHVDTQTRLDWLRKSEAPLFLARELQAYNEEILTKWEKQVLRAHIEVLERQFTQANLEVLARAPTNPIAISTRKQMLLEQSQAWQGAMESLQIAASRWNGLHQNDLKRAQAARTVRGRVLDLYLSAGVLAELNRSSGASATNAVFGRGFAALLRSLEELSLPFDERMFMRDAEVVLSRSVDPEKGSHTLLRDLEQLARISVRDAQESVDRVLSDAHADELNAKVLTDRMRTQEEELRSEVVSLCGLPLGCTVSDMATREECKARTSAGACGFAIDPLTGQFEPVGVLEKQENISEAGKAVLRFREAVLDKRIVEEEFRANEERARIEYENAEAFALNLTRWMQMRQSVAREVGQISRELDRIGNRALQAELATIQKTQQLREKAYQRQKASIESWNQLRLGGVSADMEKMTAINALQMTAEGLSLGAETIDAVAQAVAEGLPKHDGASKDTFWQTRLSIGVGAASAVAAMKAVALGLESTAVRLEQELEEAQARREATLTHLENLQELGAMQTENELEALAANLRRIELQTEEEIGELEALIDALRRNLEIDLAHERDLVELRDRRERVKIRLADSSARKVAILRAELVVAQRLQEYLQVVQRAQLLEGRHAALVERLEHLEVLIASPSVIFAFSNRLARAESRLDRAKGLLYDWVVALEYFAVRPFLDQRLAILLARNPSQLEAIANELLRLQRACGGSVNYEVVDLSLRDDLLGMGFDATGPTESGPVSSAAERFRGLLRKGNVPVDTQIRYSSDERIGDLIASRDVLAASFDVRLEDFANLPLACNAKIVSVDLQLVGGGLGDHVRPVVSLLYDGTSSLRSCQPNIETVVGALPPGRTSFGSITTFRTAGRSVSPIANIGTFGAPDSANRGLEGLPLASSYTVLIDPAAGENHRIVWDALEDIRLQITYAYQDLFPRGQCE